MAEKRLRPRSTKWSNNSFMNVKNKKKLILNIVRLLLTKLKFSKRRTTSSSFKSK